MRITLPSTALRDGTYRVLRRRGYGAECVGNRVLVTDACPDAIAAAITQYEHDSRPETNYNHISNPDGI